MSNNNPQRHLTVDCLTCPKKSSCDLLDENLVIKAMKCKGGNLEKTGLRFLKSAGNPLYDGVAWEDIPVDGKSKFFINKEGELIKLD